MAQGAPDNLGDLDELDLEEAEIIDDGDDHRSVDLEEDLVNWDDYDNFGANGVSSRPPASDESTMREATSSQTRPTAEKVKFCNIEDINPSIPGWSIKLRLGNSINDDVLAAVKTIRAWQATEIFHVEPEDIQPGSIIRIGHNENYDADHFEDHDLQILTHPALRGVATAPDRCIKKSSVGEIRQVVRRKLNQPSNGHIVARLERCQFRTFSLFCRAADTEDTLKVLGPIAEKEGLIFQVIKYKGNIQKIYFQKGPMSRQSMLSAHANIFAKFMPKFDE